MVCDKLSDWLVLFEQTKLFCITCLGTVTSVMSLGLHSAIQIIPNQIMFWLRINYRYLDWNPLEIKLQDFLKVLNYKCKQPQTKYVKAFKRFRIKARYKIKPKNSAVGNGQVN